MTRLTLDASTLARLHNLANPLEVCDESGRILGYFHPSAPAGTRQTPQSPFSDEEIQSRRQQRTGRPLAEILERLSRQ